MDLQKLKELAFQHMGSRKAHREREMGFIYYHGQRVANIAVTLRKLVLPEDDSKDDLLTAAAFFHDIAKGIEPHGQYGAVLAGELLKEHCKPDELSEITELIRCHQLREKGAGYSEHIKILQDADILDHFGVIEIWMNFQYYAFTDGPVTESVKFYKEEFPKFASVNGPAATSPRFSTAFGIANVRSTAPDGGSKVSTARSASAATGAAARQRRSRAITGMCVFNGDTFL
jgi:uncharacterized protein